MVSILGLSVPSLVHLLLFGLAVGGNLANPMTISPLGPEVNAALGIGFSALEGVTLSPMGS